MWWRRKPKWMEPEALEQMIRHAFEEQGYTVEGIIFPRQHPTPGKRNWWNRHQLNEWERLLRFASAAGHKDLVLLSLEKGVDVNTELERGMTALLLAAANGHLQTVRLLLFRGADIQAKTREGQTALTLAAENGHTDVLRLLIASEADRLPKSEEEWPTALAFSE